MTITYKFANDMIVECEESEFAYYQKKYGDLASQEQAVAKLEALQSALPCWSSRVRRVRRSLKTPIRHRWWKAVSEHSDATIEDASTLRGLVAGEAQGFFEHVEDDEEEAAPASDPLQDPSKRQFAGEPKLRQKKDDAPPRLYPFGKAYKSNSTLYRLPEPKWDDLPKAQRIARFKASKAKWYPPAGEYCYVHWDVYQNPERTREKNKFKVCAKCRTKDALSKAAKAASLNRVIGELAVRIPGLFVPPSCPSNASRCECTYASGCKALAEPLPGVLPLPVARPRTREEALQISLREYLKPIGRYEGSLRDLAQAVDADMTLVGKALGAMVARGDIERRTTRGRNGSTVIVWVRD